VQTLAKGDNSSNEPRNQDEWVSEVEEKVKEGANLTERRQMLVNLNYYVGNQWIIWDSTQRQVVTAPNPNNQERITHNVLRSRVMSKLAKQTKNRIKYDVRPDTTSQDRIETAKAATKYVNVWWDEQEMDLKTRDIHLNNNVKGWCALKVVFDNTKGEDVTPSPDEMPEGFDPEEPVYTGVITAQVIDALCLTVDPAATTDEEIRWIVEEKPRDIDHIYEKYNVKVSAEPNVNYMSSYDVTQTASSGLATSAQSRKTPNMAMVKELWVMPCEKYPRGLKVTTASGQLLDYDDNAGENPYVIFGDIPIPATVKYQAFLQDMLPIQRTINIVKTQMATHMKRMGNSMWAIPMGSEVDEEMLSNDEGGIFYYNGEFGQPLRVAPNDLPSFFDRILEYMQRDLDDMSGVREISGNALPAGLDTASGLALMVEQENEKLAVTAQGYERGMKKVLKRVLQLMKAHYTEERQAKILGPDNEIELVSFRGSDLSGDEDIDIVQGSSLPEMRSAQEDRIMTLWNSGAIVNDSGQPDPNKLLKLMGMGDSKHLYEMDQLDENKSKMENRQYREMAESPQMLQQAQRVTQQKAQIEQQNQAMQQALQAEGIPPEMAPQPVQVPPPPPFMPHVRDFQNHDIHVYNHNLFRKSTDYENLPPEVQAMVDAHIAEHVQYIQQAAASAPPPPDIAVKQEANEIKREQVQLDAKNDEAKLQVEVMKIKSDEQQAMLQTAVKVESDREARREGHEHNLQSAVVQSKLSSKDKN
jgi:hypothetical protein